MIEFRKTWNEHYSVSRCGKVRNDKTGKILKSQKAKRGGYMVVTLAYGPKNQCVKIHRAVAFAFLGPSLMHVNHIDGNKENNHADNLEYTTILENNRHARRINPDINNNGRKVSDEQVRLIKYIRSTYFMKNKEIAKVLNLSQSCIQAITSGGRFAHIKYIPAAPL